MNELHIYVLVLVACMTWLYIFYALRILEPSVILKWQATKVFLNLFNLPEKFSLHILNSMIGPKFGEGLPSKALEKVEGKILQVTFS